MARDNFHPSDYMSNLDVIRNKEIPWDYARDVVPSSQLNSIYLFGGQTRTEIFSDVMQGQLTSIDW